MNNTRFATAIHIMTLLAKKSPLWTTSDWIAGSININAVMVRNELIVLKKSGLVESKQGKDGGVRLSKSEEEITIAEIYEAIKNSEVLGKKNQKTNPLCNVGKDINEKLEVLFSDTDDLVLQFLKEKKLSNFSNQFN